MSHEDALRRRAEAGAHRGADDVWEAATRGRTRWPARATIAVALVLIATVSLVWAINRSDDGASTDIGPAEPSTSDDVAPDDPPVSAEREPVCRVVILNASGRPGVAAAAGIRVREFLTARDLVQPDGGVAVDIFNAVATTDRSAVLLPVERSCRYEGLSADPLSYPEPTLAPWPEELAELLPDALQPASVILILGHDTEDPVNTAEQVVVPDVIGLTVAEALDALAKTGFPAEIDTGEADEPVLFTEPGPGEIVAVGSRILISTRTPDDAFRPIDLDSLGDAFVAPCAGAPGADFVEYRTGDTPEAPHGLQPDEAALLFPDWINARPSSLEGFRIASMPEGWHRLTDSTGAVAFGWTAPGTETSGLEYHQLLFAETDGINWWISRFETSGC